MKQLKINIQKDLSDDSRGISDQELVEIVERINNTRKEDQTKENLESILTKVLEVKAVSLSEESLGMLISDNSDLNNYLKQLEEALKNRKK